MTTLTSWQHRLRGQSTSAAAILAALATIIGAWQLALPDAGGSARSVR